MEISRYTDSKWHKRQVEEISRIKKKEVRDLYYKDMLPCIIYILEKTSFEIIKDKEGASFKLNTVKLDDLKIIQEYKIAKKALKNAIILQIEGYLIDESNQALKRKEQLSHSAIIELKDTLVNALSLGETENIYPLSKIEMGYLLTENNKNLKLKFKEKKLAKINNK